MVLCGGGGEVWISREAGASGWRWRENRQEREADWAKAVRMRRRRDRWDGGAIWLAR